MSSVVSSLLLDIQGNVASLKQSLDEGKSQLGEFKENALKIGEAMGIAFGAEKLIELGKQFGEFALRVGETKEQVEALNINGSVEKATASVLALSQTFGVDLKESLSAINVNSQAFGETFDSSSKKVEQGLALTTGHAQEFLAIVQGYSRSFAAAGVSADQFAAIATQAVQKGFGDEAFAGLQKGIKQIELMSPTAQKALEAVGLNTQQIAQQIAAGTLTPLQVIQQMGEKLKELPSTSQQAAEAMNLFGKSSTQLAGFVQFLSDAKTNMNDLVDSATEGQQAMLHLNESTEQLDEIWTQLFCGSATYWTELKANLIDGLVTGLKAIANGVVESYNYFVDLYNQSFAFRIIIQALIADFKILWDSIKLIGNIGADVFEFLGREIKDVFTGNFKDIPKALATEFQNIAKDSAQWGKNIYDEFATAFKAAADARPLSHLTGIGDLSGEGEQKSVNGITGDGYVDQPDKAGGKSKSKGDNNSLLINIQKNDPSKYLDKIKTSIDGVVKTAQYMPDIFDKIGDSFSTNIEKTAYPAMEKLGESIGNAAQTGSASLQQLTNQTLQTAGSIIKANLAKAISEVIASAGDLPFPFDLAAISASVALVNSIPIPQFATGSQNFEGGWAKINEGGIGNGEAVFLPSGSAVLPARETQGFLGNNAAPKIHVNVTGRISGRDILLSQNETNRIINNSR